MFRRLHRRFAWVALLIATVALSGARIVPMPSAGTDGFAFCSAVNKAGADGGPGVPGDPRPSNGPAGGHDHCPLCGSAAAAATGRLDLAAAAPQPGADAPAFAPGPAPHDGRGLARVRPQPPPARG